MLRLKRPVQTAAIAVDQQLIIHQNALLSCLCALHVCEAVIVWQWEYGVQNRHVGTEFKGLPGSCHLGCTSMSEQSFCFQKPALA